MRKAQSLFNFLMIVVRSGQFGRVGLSSSLQRAFQRWLNEASVGKLLSASIGNDPSLRDVLRMARPKPKDDVRRALFGWLTDKSTSGLQRTSQTCRRRCRLWLHTVEQIPLRLRL